MTPETAIIRQNSAVDLLYTLNLRLYAVKTEV